MEYIPYDKGWRNEVGRLTKAAIIDLLELAAKERDFYRARFELLAAAAPAVRAAKEGPRDDAHGRREVK